MPLLMEALRSGQGVEAISKLVYASLSCGHAQVAKSVDFALLERAASEASLSVTSRIHLMGALLVASILARNPAPVLALLKSLLQFCSQHVYREDVSLLYDNPAAISEALAFEQSEKTGELSVVEGANLSQCLNAIEAQSLGY
jgi:hypothetical protein